MGRFLDIVSVLLLVAAGGAFSAGVYALGDQKDLIALYWLGVGGLLLRAAVDLLRPKAGAR